MKAKLPEILEVTTPNDALVFRIRASNSIPAVGENCPEERNRSTRPLMDSAMGAVVGIGSPKQEKSSWFVVSASGVRIPLSGSVVSASCGVVAASIGC